jgi:phosphinothricin acetyltransferase
MEVRAATIDDLPGILEIFNDAIVNTTAVWRDAPEDLATRRRWFEARRARGFPVLVATEDRQVLGFGSYGDFRMFDGYRHTVEHSVYVRGDRRRAGLGRALLDALLDRARAHHIHAMIGGIEASNDASLALHAAMGFREVARMPQVGCKFGRWLDLVFVQRLLDARAMPGKRPD